MYKKKKEDNIEYVYALYAKIGDREPLMVMNDCLPVFANEKAGLEFIKEMIEVSVDDAPEVILKKVIITPYDKKDIKTNKKTTERSPRV